MRILFALPGLHRYDRGAEVAFISIAEELSTAGDEVTLVGSGSRRPGASYRYIQARSVDRRHFESFPTFPPFRNDCAYEEFTFLPSLLSVYRPSDYDITLTCGYPFTNWALRRPDLRRPRPPHIFVTQNGDWPAYARNSEYRFFGCDGLVCTNPDFYARSTTRWHCCLIPNGVNTALFRPGLPERQKFDLPLDRTVVLMVSALIPSKRVEEGIEAARRVPNSHLIVAGNGPLRDVIVAKAKALLPDRFNNLSVHPEQMPALYRSADVFLHMSREESFGNVFLEAAACGLPIVAHDTPRLRWILGDREFLTDTDSSEAVANKITLAAQAASNFDQIQRTERTLAFSWSRISQMYRAFLEDVLQRSG